METLFRRVPTELRDALKADAAVCLRSMNQHAAFLLIEAMKARRDREQRQAEAQ
ncbi:hypothetical protein [Bradyrhizobium jicamae]|uniref:hypothetical protein n=1 Tax=Bradyrhizobium jicamae TaxID=280332 RepID=UPI001BA5F0BC|nr:hypothetical protein [Bradyrhizobium jicamae]MBR0936991.1 hypothetical protein [Bradyrhizobium jicamae]